MLKKSMVTNFCNDLRGTLQKTHGITVRETSLLMSLSLYQARTWLLAAEHFGMMSRKGNLFSFV